MLEAFPDTACCSQGGQLRVRYRHLLPPAAAAPCETRIFRFDCCMQEADAAVP